MLKARGSLLPPGLEALASEQRAEEKAEELLRAAVEGAPRVHVAAAAPSMKKLERSRSQQLRLSLEEPAAQQLLQHAAELAADGRGLAAHAALLQLGEQAGGSLAERASLGPDALAAALPAGASLDIGRVVAEAQQVCESLEALDDSVGWMVSRDDSLQVLYRHQKGTTVHRQALCCGQHLLAQPGCGVCATRCDGGPACLDACMRRPA